LAAPDAQVAGIRKALKAWTARDDAALIHITGDAGEPPNVRAYAAFLRAKRGQLQDTEAFLRAFPRDSVSLEWLALQAKDVIPQEELVRACADGPSACEPVAMSERVVVLATEGNRLANGTFVESWLTHSDGGVSEWVCRDLVPRIMKAAPATLIEEASRTPKGGEALQTCVDFSLAGVLASPQIDAIERVQVSGDSASQLLKKIVSQLRNPNPDWP